MAWLNETMEIQKNIKPQVDKYNSTEKILFFS